MKTLSNFEIFKSTLPVMMGYLPLGLAFGLYAISLGIEPWVVIFTALLVYAGSAEFMLAIFIVTKASFLELFFVIFLINFRHFFYTLSLLDEIKTLKFPFYFIFALTDESFAMLKARSLSGENPQDLNRLYNLTALFNHCYWLIGCAFGAFLGMALPFNYAGIEFSLCALFAILAYEIFKKERNFNVLSLAFALAFGGLFILPDKYYLFGVLIAGMSVLCVFRRYF